MTEERMKELEAIIEKGDQERDIAWRAYNLATKTRDSAVFEYERAHFNGYTYDEFIGRHIAAHDKTIINGILIESIDRRGIDAITDLWDGMRMRVSLGLDAIGSSGSITIKYPPNERSQWGTERNYHLSKLPSKYLPTYEKIMEAIKPLQVAKLKYRESCYR